MTSVTNIKDLNKEKKDKLYELDYMRFIACFAVIIVHITATGVTGYIHGSFPHIAILTINRFLKFTTPIFIFLSGVTSFYSYRKRKFEYFPFIKRRLEKVLVAYLLWCVIYYVVYIRVGFYTFNISFFIDNVIKGTMSYHLYFVIIITQMYIVGPIFYKVLKNSDKKVLILIFSAIVTMLCAQFLTFKNSDRFFMKYVFFYMLGIYVTMEHKTFITWIEKYKYFMAVGYFSAATLYTWVSFSNHPAHMYVWFIFSLFAVFFIYIVGLRLKVLFSRFYSFVKLFSQSSYFIYLMHPLVLTFAIMYTDNNGILSITKRLLIYSGTVIPITVISCLLFTYIRNKIKKKRKAAITQTN